MTSPNVPVDGPFRITVVPLPTGVALDVEGFAHHIVQGVVETLLRDDAYADRLGELYEALPTDPHIVQAPSDLPVEQFVADLVAVVGTRLPVYGLQALRLAERVEQLAAPVVAGLQAAKGGAAA
ncbi:hypothetical protein AB0420_02150 [Streptomyces caelestis]|uniref:hypothetical protein n=1 Tax=Streptomyces caelestis TaxID=36816 RepID=UPI00344E271A